ncbi:MAG: hypothetical protein AAFP19_03760 [Bacteroidota bacterium]
MYLSLNNISVLLISLLLLLPITGASREGDDLLAPIQQDSVPLKDTLLTLLRNNASYTVDIMAFGRAAQFAEAIGTVNPDNRVAQLNNYDVGLYFRPELKYRGDKLGLWAKPRLNIDVDLDEEGLTKEDYATDFYFQELKGKWQINNSLYLLAGRYLKEMGTSLFVNPSNPFLVNNGRLNPKIEIRPMDFIELNFSTKSAWSFSLIANINEADSPIYQEPFFDFKRNYGLMAEYYGLAENIGVLASMDEDGKFHLGAYGQKNLTEAVLLWTDFSLNYNYNRFYPVQGHWTDPQLLDYDMINGSKNDGFSGAGLLGASYTLNIGPTIQVEYFFNGKGYTNDEFEMLLRSIDSSSRYSFDVTRDLANSNLGRALNTGMPFIRRNYLFFQVGEQDRFEQLNYNLRYIYSIDDQSSQFSSLIEWNLNSFEIYSVLLMGFGGRDTDLNLLLDFQLMLGIIYKI